MKKHKKCSEQQTEESDYELWFKAKTLSYISGLQLCFSNDQTENIFEKKNHCDASYPLISTTV